MKINYEDFGSLILEAEDSRDRLWLREFLVSTQEKDRELLSRFISVDMEDMCVSEKKYSDGKNMPMKQCTIPEVMDDEDGEPWGAIESIRITPYGDLV